MTCTCNCIRDCIASAPLLPRYECEGGLEQYVLGLHSFGGSFAFFSPTSGIAVAILLNDAQLEALAATVGVDDLTTADF